ncbi:hypothetical protein SLS60_012098 [Paraconiothyrium brasiliense]|uniref:Uncharacterized protein n=1 Tax=Paraconiothyrium brasiliense TaxID=300254 RepID=A0ABR3QGJ9_9PLEO
MSASIHNESRSPSGGLDNLLDESRSCAEEIAAPLTEEVLAVWEDTFNSPDDIGTARNSTPRRKTRTLVIPENLDERDQLEDYNVRIHVDDPKPAELQRHLDNVVLKPREGHPSPKGKEVTKARGLAARHGEDTAVNILEDTSWAIFMGGIMYITYDLKPRLSRDFLPPAPRPAVEWQHKSLSQPEPDLCYGYITRKLAERAGTAPAFTQEEEEKLNLSPLFLLKNQWFPCITAQWKSAIGGESVFEAQSQGRRDGAVIVPPREYHCGKT